MLSSQPSGGTVVRIGHDRRFQLHLEEAGDHAFGRRRVLYRRAGEAMAHAFERNEPVEPFTYKDKGSLATIGRNKAVADLGKIKFQGFFAWLVWMFVHLISLLGFRNKVIVYVNWIGSYLNNNGGARLIIRREWNGPAGRDEG